MTKRSPTTPCKIPEVHRLSICDEKCLTCCATVFQLILRRHQVFGSEYMCMCHIVDISEVPQIGVVPDLECSLAVADNVVHPRDDSTIAWTKNSRRTKCTSQKASCV